MQLSDQKPEETLIYYNAVVRRVSQLYKVTHLKGGVKAPPHVIAFILKGVIIAAFGYCGTEIIHWFFSWIQENTRDYHRLCHYCGVNTIEDFEMGSCTVCKEQEAKLDLEFEEPVPGQH